MLCPATFIWTRGPGNRIDVEQTKEVIYEPTHHIALSILQKWAKHRCLVGKDSRKEEVHAVPEANDLYEGRKLGGINTWKRQRWRAMSISSHERDIFLQCTLRIEFELNGPVPWMLWVRNLFGYCCRRRNSGSMTAWHTMAPKADIQSSRTFARVSVALMLKKLSR